VLAAVDALRQRAGAASTDPLARSVAEEAVETWADARGVEEPWRWGAGVVQAGLTADDLDRELGGLDARRTGAALALLVATADARRLADDIAEGARRMSTIVAALRSHSHLDRAPVTEVDLHEGLENTITLLGHQLRDITVTRDLAPDVPAVPGNGGALNQVWTNLLHNAADALRDAGVEDPHITVRTRRNGDAVGVEVEDDGPGIPEELRDRMFDAFVTTKAPGAGTGLGLHLTREIVVRDHGGSIEVDSRPGRTVIRVLLPVTPPEPTSEAARRAATT
jgi:signal transduction histidine kinase